MLFLINIILIKFTFASYPISDHYNGEVFSNLTENHEKTLWDVLTWKWNSTAEAWPESIPNRDYKLPLIYKEKVIVTFINHATFLIQLPNLTILTDPIYAERASPISFAGPIRSRAPGIKFDDLPKIDVVLISHNHYDHLDIETLRLIEAKFSPLFLVPLGDEKFLRSEGMQKVRAMDWWEVENREGIKIHFTPAQHWSSRGMFDKRKSLWGSYYIEGLNTKIYFAGDTGYSPHFKLIRDKLGAPDLALLPIGAYLPRDFMQMAHMNPEDAVLAHKDLGANISFAMHFGTFPMADDSIDQPLVDLVPARLKQEVDPAAFRVLDQGESYLFSI